MTLGGLKTGLAAVAAALPLAVLGWGVGRLQGCQQVRQATAALEAERALRAIGATPGTVETPKIPETPRGATPLLTATARGRYGIVRTGSAPGPTDRSQPPATSNPAQPGAESPSGAGVLPASGGTPPPEAPSTPAPGPWPAASDLACDTALDSWLVAGVPWGRIRWTARLQGPEGGDYATESGIGEDLKLTLSPKALPPAWHLDLLAGGSAGLRPGIEAGAAWTGRRRLGAYLLAEWQPASGTDPATWRVHGGVRFRVR